MLQSRPVVAVFLAPAPVLREELEQGLTEKGVGCWRPRQRLPQQLPSNRSQLSRPAQQVEFLFSAQVHPGLAVVLVS